LNILSVLGVNSLSCGDFGLDDLLLVLQVEVTF
jgi:hypothetical protein